GGELSFHLDPGQGVGGSRDVLLELARPRSLVVELAGKNAKLGNCAGELGYVQPGGVRQGLGRKLNPGWLEKRAGPLSGDDDEVRGLAGGGERAVHPKPFALLEGELIAEHWALRGDLKVGKARRENVDQQPVGDRILGRFRLHQLRERKPGWIAQPAE